MYNEIVSKLEGVDTEEAAVCRVVNSRMSKQGLPKLVIPSHLFPSVGMCNPFWDLLVVEFLSPSELKKDNNGHIIKVHYNFSKDNLDAFAKLEVKEGVVYWTGLPNGMTYPVGKLGEEAIHSFEWPLRAPETHSKKAKGPAPEKGIMDNLEANTRLLEAMERLPVTLTGRHSHGGMLFEKYTYVQTLSEYAFAVGMNEREVYGKWLPTHYRTQTPLPWGGISTERKTYKSMSEEDKLQLEGRDIELFNREVSNIHRKTPLKGKSSIDVKLISSVGEPGIGCKRYSDVPVEALTENIHLSYNHPKRFNFYDNTMWTWDEDSEADIGYILRDKAYLIPKRVLQKAVKERVEKARISEMEISDGLRPNIKANKKGIKKWCAWFTEEEIKKMAIVEFTLHPLYGELLKQHSEELLSLYSNPDLGEEYTHRQLRYFNRHI